MNQFKVGLMAIMTIAALGYMSFKITSNQSGFGDYIVYRTIISDASGIFPKTPIKVAGINSGRIITIELQGNTALITFEVLKKVRVTEGTKLNIKSVGFLGDKYLELFINEQSKKILGEMALVPSVEAGGMEQMTQSLGAVLQDVKVITSSLRNSLAPEGDGALLTNMVADMRAIAGSLKRLVTDNESKLSSIVQNLDGVTKKLYYQVDAGQRDSLMSDLKGITSGLAEVVADLKNGKGTLGQMLMQDEVMDEVKETLAGVKKMVGGANKIRTQFYIDSGLNQLEGAQTSAGLIIIPSPDRFYNVGVVTSEFGVVREKNTTQQVDSAAATVTNTKIVDKDTYKFNAQIGKKFNRVAFRGGFFDSTGGVGIDYDFRPLSTVLSAEVFDYSSTTGINLRFSAGVHIWNVVYGKFQLNDTLNGTDNYSVGLGLRFKDEDLKSLLKFVF